MLREQHPFRVSMLAFIALEVFKGMEYFHKKGVVHRNIKPHNIMFTDQGEIKIIGFGIGTLHKGGKERIIGTPYYMSPEQIQGIEIDNRSDIYSFGVTLFHLITGRIPFIGSNNIYYQHLFEPPPSIKKFRTDIPDKLIEIVEKCMEKKSENRYQDAREIIEEIETIKVGSGS